MNNFRKMSKYMNKDSFNTISEFLVTDDKSKEGTKLANGKKEVKMFEDLNEENINGNAESSDVEMD